MSDELSAADLDGEDEEFRPWPSIDGVLASQEDVDSLIVERERLRDAWKLADADRYRAYRERDQALADLARVTAERDELRAVLAPLLDQWMIRIGTTRICKICGGSELDRTPLEHRPDCPVLARDRLLGRAL